MLCLLMLYHISYHIIYHIALHYIISLNVILCLLMLYHISGLLFKVCVIKSCCDLSILYMSITGMVLMCMSLNRQ